MVCWGGLWKEVLVVMCKIGRELCLTVKAGGIHRAEPSRDRFRLVSRNSTIANEHRYRTSSPLCSFKTI